MNVLGALIDYGQASLTPENDWYRWKKINPEYLPAGVVLPDGTEYSKNVALKRSLSGLYAAGDENTRIELTRYYIVIWGGVRGNKAEKIRAYALSAPGELITKGRSGIASWSKALCVRDPEAYAIYDARVALALNCLQVAYEVEAPLLFPLLYGQNKKVNEGAKRMEHFAYSNQWAEVRDGEFYALYNDYLAQAAMALGIAIYTLEMLLFSKVSDLYELAYPEANQ